MKYYAIRKKNTENYISQDGGAVWWSPLTKDCLFEQITDQFLKELCERYPGVFKYPHKLEIIVIDLTLKPIAYVPDYYIHDVMPKHEDFRNLYDFLNDKYNSGIYSNMPHENILYLADKYESIEVYNFKHRTK